MKVSPELKVFVGGIGIGTTEEDVKNYFSSFGKVKLYKNYKIILFIAHFFLKGFLELITERLRMVQYNQTSSNRLLFCLEMETSDF